MKLTHLSLKNFKGHSAFTIDNPGAGNITVSGHNGAGKTTIGDGLSWLLTGKDSRGRADFRIKPLTPDGEESRHLEHEASAKFIDADGVVHEFTRVLRELHTTTKGSAAREYKGNTTAFFVNRVPVERERDFQDAVARAFAPEETLRCLTQVEFFCGALDWTKRRRILLDACGDVSQADVIASNRELDGLEELLSGRSVDDHRKMLTANRKASREEIDQIPARIQENQLTVSSHRGADLSSELQARQQAVEKLQRDKVTAEAGGSVAEKRRELADLKAKGANIVATLIDTANRDRRDALASVESARSSADAARRLIDNCTANVRDAEARLQRMDAELETVRSEFTLVKNESVDAGADSCPACGQALPAEKLQAAVEAANARKSTRLEQIQARGKSLRASRDEHAEALEQMRKDLEDARLKAKMAATALEEAESSVPASSEVDPSDSPEWIENENQQTLIRAELEELGAGAAGEIARIDQALAEAQGKLREVQQAKAAADQAATAAKRIEELETRQTELAGVLEEIERGLYLCDQYVRAHVRLLTDRINSLFKVTRFKLFEEQLNGGLAECCEATLRGVPYSGNLSTSERIKIGLDVIETLGQMWDLRLPIVIDGAESILEIPTTTAQQIRLVVADHPLTVQCASVSATAPKPKAKKSEPQGELLTA